MRGEIFFFAALLLELYGYSSRHEDEHPVEARRCHIQRLPVGDQDGGLDDEGGPRHGNGTLLVLTSPSRVI